MTHANETAATYEDWRRLVEKTLKGEPIDSLNCTTAEGLPIAPLYDAADGTYAHVAGRPENADRPWDLRVGISPPDPRQANRDLLRDLQGGAASAVIVIDPSGEQGVAIGSPEDLAVALADVVLEFAPVGLDAGFLGPQAAAWLASAAKGSPQAKLNFHMDPLSALAETGTSPGPLEAHLGSSADLAGRLVDIHPKAGIFLASGRVVHEAGGGEAAELAFAAAAAVTYAKAQVQTGLSMTQAWAGIVLGLSADADYFATLAKLRAARMVWDRLTTACDVKVPARIEVRSSHRMLTAQDPWTNMLRLTAAGVGAALGGADAIQLGCFTDAWGVPPLLPVVKVAMHNWF